MNKVSFYIQVYKSGWCRIVARDCRTVIRNLSDGACITSMDVLTGEMKRITAAAKEMNFSAAFEVVEMD